MDSSSSNNNTNSHIFHHQQQQPSSGLLRFRSAPSSFLANFNDNGGNNSSNSLLGFPDFDDKSAEIVNFTNSTHSFSGLPPHYPRNSTSSSAMDGSFGLIGSVAMGSENQPKRVDSSLSRQNSSPPGLFVQNGYASMKGMCSYTGAIRTNSGELSPRLKTQLSFSSRSPSSLGMLDEIETETETIVDSGKLGSGSNGGRFYGTGGFPYNSWNDSTFSGSFDGLKRGPNDPAKLFSNSQNGEVGNGVQLLSHHLSLPKASVDMGAVEKFLQYQDSVPCKIRAKRGCATHPRSIAERIRRTRISERMKKLQELVPNMEKQTNTADMLDFAVDYIKELQKQYTILRNSRANCNCSSKLKSGQNQVV